MIYGCLGGLIVYILGDIQSLLFKTNILHGFRNHLFIILGILGIVTSMVVLLNYRTTIYGMIIRTVVLIISQFMYLIISGLFGIEVFLDDLLNIVASAANDNVAGLVHLMFIIINSTILLLAMFVVLIKRLILKNKSKKN